jgi:hypothetical protein
VSTKWRELAEEIERFAAAYGTDPEWAEPLNERRALLQKGKVALGITEDEESGAVKIKHWPIPSGMLRILKPTDDRHRYIQYLTDWFYRRLSQEVHHSWSGLARSYPLLGPKQLSDSSREYHLELLRTRQVNISLTLMMAVITELELEFRFGLNERAKYVWSILRGWSDEARDVYDHSYAPILGTADVANL